MVWLGHYGADTLHHHANRRTAICQRTLLKGHQLQGRRVRLHYDEM